MGLLFISCAHSIIVLFCKKNCLKALSISFLFAMAWLLLTTILHCIPGSKLPKITWEDKIWLDKWIHGLLFLVLVILWCRVYFLKRSNVNSKQTFIIITILAVTYGIGLEIVQGYFIPFRSFAYGDMIADVVGSAAGYFISINRFKKNRIQK